MRTSRRGHPSTAGRRGARVAAVALALTVVLSACSIDWTMRLADTAHSGHTPDDGLSAANASALTAKWRLQAPKCAGAPFAGGGFGSTAVTFKGVVYVGANNGCLLAVNEADGSVRWSRFFAFQPDLTCSQQLGIISTVEASADANGNPVLTFHSPDGYLYKLDGLTGSTITRSLVQLPSKTNPPGNDVYAWSSPNSTSSLDIVGISSNCDTPFVQGKLVAYDRASGALVWTHKTMPDGYAGAGVWTDPGVASDGSVWATTGSTYDSTNSAHPNTASGFEQYSLIKVSSTDGRLLCKAPAPAAGIGDPDYASSPIFFTGTIGGVTVPLVGASNKDGWFRTYRQSDCRLVWQAFIGTATPDGLLAPLAGGVWDGSRLFVMGNDTRVGGTWSEPFPGVWLPTGGHWAFGAIRRLDPSTGDIVASGGGGAWAVELPSNPLAACSINGRGILACAGGHFEDQTARVPNDPLSLTGHDNGVFLVDTNGATPRVVAHLQDVANFPEFPQPVQEHGAVITASTDALVKWGP